MSTIHVELSMLFIEGNRVWVFHYALICGIILFWIHSKYPSWSFNNVGEFQVVILIYRCELVVLGTNYNQGSRNVWNYPVIFSFELKKGQCTFWIHILQTNTAGVILPDPCNIYFFLTLMPRHGWLKLNQSIKSIDLFQSKIQEISVSFEDCGSNSCMWV